MLGFDEIFGPGKFDNQDNTYRREFPGVEAGGTRNVLDFDTLWEHSNRRGYDVTPYPNGNSRDLQIENGKIEASVENFPDGRTVLELDFDDEINDIQAYMEASVDQWLGEVIRREQKAYRAATNYVHNILPRRAEEEGLPELEVLEQDLDFSQGESLSSFHEEYRNGQLNDIGLSYASEFELWPFEDGDMDRSDLPGKMPSADEMEDPELRSRNDLYQRRFLEAVVEEAMNKYGKEDDMQDRWMNYVDLGFS